MMWEMKLGTDMLHPDNASTQLPKMWCYSVTPLKEKCQTCFSVAELLNSSSGNKDNKRINLYIMEWPN